MTHHLDGVDEIYLILRGKGRVKVGTFEEAEVKAGDTIFIPSGTSQLIANVGKTHFGFLLYLHASVYSRLLSR